MNRFRLILLLSLVSASALSAAAAGTPKDHEQQIIEAERHGDIQVFAKLLADKCVTIGPDGRRHTKEEISQILRSVGKQNVSTTDLIVLPAGKDTAIVNYVVNASMPDGSTRQHTATSIWVRRGHTWQMMFHQGTEIPR